MTMGTGSTINSGLGNLKESILAKDFFFDKTNTSWTTIASIEDDLSSTNIGNWTMTYTWTKTSGTGDINSHFAAIRTQKKKFLFYSGLGGNHDNYTGNSTGEIKYNRPFKELKIKCGLYSGEGYGGANTASRRIRVGIFNNNDDSQIGNWLDIFTDTGSTTRTDTTNVITRQNWKFYKDGTDWKMDWINTSSTNVTNNFGSDSTNTIYFKINVYCMVDHRIGQQSTPYGGLWFENDDNLIEIE